VALPYLFSCRCGRYGLNTQLYVQDAAKSLGAATGCLCIRHTQIARGSLEALPICDLPAADGEPGMSQATVLYGTYPQPL